MTLQNRGGYDDVLRMRSLFVSYLTQCLLNTRKSLLRALAIHLHVTKRIKRSGSFAAVNRAISDKAFNIHDIYIKDCKSLYRQIATGVPNLGIGHRSPHVYTFHQSFTIKSEELHS